MRPDPPVGAKCFLDANILVYYFVRTSTFSAACWDFMRRVQTGEVLACTSNSMISEAMHRIMLADVDVRFNAAKPLAYVQRHPEIIAGLATYHAAATAMQRLSIEVLELNLSDYREIAATAASHSLLTDDASTVMLMKRNGISYLITNDDDFDSVPGIIVCKPR